MSPKRDPRRVPVPTPAPSSFLGTIPKKGSAAAAARSAGGPVPARPQKETKPEVRGDKRQRNSSGSTDLAEAKKLRDGSKFDPKGEAVPLGGARHAPPSPTTSVSTIQSEITDGGVVEDKEVGDELEEIKACINQMKVKPMPLGTQVCT